MHDSSVQSYLTLVKTGTMCSSYGISIDLCGQAPSFEHKNNYKTWNFMLFWTWW